MVDIDEILAAAIRTAWLQVNGPSLGRLIISKSPGTFARLSSARELSSLHPARSAATANVTHCRTPGTLRIRRSSERKARWRLLGAAAGKSRFEGALERSGRLGTLNHDQIVILALETGRGKVLVSELYSPVRPASRNLYFLTLCHVDGLSYPESVVQSVVSDMTKEFMEIGKLAKKP